MKDLLLPTIEILDIQIMNLKDIMIEIGLKHGLTSEPTLQVSQELDRLIVEHQTLTRYFGRVKTI